jgi:Holliday junction resolvase RusA-like endonuclease
MQRLIIEGALPSLNEIIAAAKSHWAAYAKEKRQRTTSIALLATIAKLKPVSGPCVVRCLWYEKDRRRDPDNVRVGMKFVLDGLVEAGVLPSDGWAVITGLEDRFYVDKERPRIEVEIIPEPS